MHACGHKTFHHFLETIFCISRLSYSQIFIPHSESSETWKTLNLGMRQEPTHTGVLELVEDHLRNKVVGDLLSIRLDAADEVGVGLTKCRHQ